jgi:hypothetical protein
MMGRIFEDLGIAQSIVPASRTVATVNGTGVDCLDVRQVGALVHVGAIGNSGTDTTLNVKLQDSDNDSDYYDLTSAAIVQLEYTDDNANPTIDVNLDLRRVKRRYVRAVGTVAGSDAVVYGVSLLLDRKVKPVTNTPVSVHA